MRMSLVTMLAVSCYAFAQVAPPGPTFEVASVKPAPPQAPGTTQVSFTTDPGRVSYTGASLMDIIAKAYNVRPSQISGRPG